MGRTLARRRGRGRGRQGARRHGQGTAFTRAVDHYNVTIGDPLLDKRILERGAYVRSFPQFTSLGFVTTLQWLHKHDVDDFLRTFTWVSVSTVLSGRERYEQFFGVDKYDSMLRNLETLITRMPVVNPSFSLHLGIKPTDEPIASVIAHPDFVRINGMVGQDLVHSMKNRSIYVDDWGVVDLPKYLKRRPIVPRWRRPPLLPVLAVP